jgi:transposase
MTANNITIGLDLGDRRHAAGVLSASGDIVAEEVITNTRECLTAFAQRHAAATLVMETGTHSPWVSRHLEALGHRVIVANAHKLRVSSETFGRREESC